MEPFNKNLPAGTDSLPFAKANLKFSARLIPSLEFLPDPLQAEIPIDLNTSSPADAESLFLELKNLFQITLPSNELKSHPKTNTFIRKYLPKSYRNAFDFSHPRSPKYGVIDDAYLCAMKKPAVAGSKLYTTDDVSWGRVFAWALRQPELAKQLGMIYKTEVPLPSPDYYKEGGWLYIELAGESDYHEQALLSPKLIKKYAARIPKLTTPRVVFAPVQFLVSDVPQAGNFDPLFIEAADFDDGFANIVHCTQPQKANLILEPDQDGLPPVKDFGIRIGWEDEQVLDWHNRLLRRPDYLPPAAPPTPGNELIDAPLGVLAYRIDVRDVNAPDDQWHSLNRAQGAIKIGDIQVGFFNGELGIEVVPTQMDGFREGEFWLPSYFTQWDGHSVVLRNDQVAELFGLHGTARNYQPVGVEEVLLRYGNIYEFRIRMSDMTGGGPGESDHPNVIIPSQTASCRFRRFVPPARVRIPSIDNVEPPGEEEEPVNPPGSYTIFRPLLGYPALLYTGLVNAFDMLKADIDKARTERREPAFADPDVVMLEIEVAVLGLEMDHSLSPDKESPYYSLFITTRDFPVNPADPLLLEVEFVDASVIKFGDPANLGDFPLTDENGPLILPTARNIRITVTPVCKPDATLKYFGSDAVRYGRPSEIYTRAHSKDEAQLFIQDIPAKQLKAILLQPDHLPDKNLEAQMNLSGKKEQSAGNLMSRFANALDLDTQGMTLMAKPGQRVVFGCAKEIRHIVSPEHSSITFSSKADLINQWIPTLILTINRDWSWNGLKDKSFTIKRDGEVVGTVELIRTANETALQNPDRTKTIIIFFDAVDPKPDNDRLPRPITLKYEVETNLVHTPVMGQPETVEIDITLPVAVRPAQVPKLVSAGIALSPYERDDNGYSWSRTRKKMLWFEFEEPVLDGKDNYFVFVKSYAPDPLLIHSGEAVEDPKENSPYIDPEFIRIITPGQSDDRSALNAMQQMIPATSSNEEKPRHFLVPLPPGISETSEELFCFFTYEVCVGHANVWCTAQGRFGRGIRITGVQHPAPPLICSVTRNEHEIVASAPYATAVYEGKNLTYGSATELWGLLYAQVMRVDGKDYRNVLLSKIKMSIRNRDYLTMQQSGYSEWSNKQVREFLDHFGIPANAPLSCLVVELLPNADRDSDPLGGDLGYTRICRTSQLEPVPEICCVNC
ncbi:MAG: hypothetical protein MRK02_12410 [Candidatus Scalindua sp.]|nr:hypothetical protein [Candidatus Scalindua sp.]